MEERKAFSAHLVSLEAMAGRETAASDLTRVFAVLAARQNVLPTAQAMRAGTVASSPADRMVCLFAARGSADSGTGAGGAFNLGTAQYLSGTQDNEASVYRGA
jgi:hypothetical protein